MNLKVFAVILVVGLALPAFAQEEAPPPVDESPCEAIALGISRAETEHQMAMVARQSAWKVLVPFAVVGRYARASSAAHEAGQRLNALHQEAALRGCHVLVDPQGR